MKAICITGSPQPKGNTAAIVSTIFRGLETQGFQTALVQLSEKNVGFCRGCKQCYRTGLCVQDDDVRDIVAEMLRADLVVVASPSYWGGVTGQMKAFIDRCTPYCNQNAAKLPVSTAAKGAAVAIRAGSSKRENQNLVDTIEHFLGHLEIPLVASFTAEGIDTGDDLRKRPQILDEAFVFGQNLGQSFP